MVRYTSILLPLALARKRRLEEAAQSQGETLESFILEAAEAEAERLGHWLSEKGHSVDHHIYSSTTGAPTWASDTWSTEDEQQIAAQRVALELGWMEGESEEWISDVDRLIDSLESLEGAVPTPVASASGSEHSRRSLRRPVQSVRVLNPVRGTVVDMSETGLGVETHGPFSVPEEVCLSIGENVTRAKIRAQVRWCVLVRTESSSNGDIVPVYRAGLAFLGH